MPPNGGSAPTAPVSPASKWSTSAMTSMPDSHKTLYKYLNGIRLHVRQTTTGTGIRRCTLRYHWMTNLPLRDGDDALRVNGHEITSQ